MAFLFTVLTWAVWWGGVVLIIKRDQAQRRIAAEREHGVSFEKQSVLPYLALGLLCGGLVLPAYFGATRRSAAGFFLGLLYGVGVFIVAVAVSFVGRLLT